MAQWLVKFGNRMATTIPALTVKVAGTSKGMCVCMYVRFSLKINVLCIN